MPLLLLEAGILLLIIYLVGVGVGYSLRKAVRPPDAALVPSSKDASEKATSNGANSHEAGTAGVVAAGIAAGVVGTQQIGNNSNKSSYEGPQQRQKPQSSSTSVASQMQTVDIGMRQSSAVEAQYPKVWPVAVGADGAAMIAASVITDGSLKDSYRRPKTMQAGGTVAADGFQESEIRQVSSTMQGAAGAGKLIDGLGDDFTAIDCITPEVERMLKTLGLRRYTQIASLDGVAVAGLNRLLGVFGRIERENWIGQADLLSKVANENSEKLRKNSTSNGSGSSSSGDDLKRIRGINVDIEVKLKRIGITTYEQLANWKPTDVERISELLNFRGRIERENWMEQARILFSGGETEFSKRFDCGEISPLATNFQS